MPKLNQVLAVEKGLKSRAYGEIGDSHKALKKPENFFGLTRTYERKSDADDELPGEVKRVSYTVVEELRKIERLSIALFDVTAQREFTNCVATADVVVDGTTIVANAPVAYLLFLEKQLTDLRTIMGDLPLLDPAEDWKLDETAALYKTSPSRANRTKKVQKPLVLIQPTPEHPGQAVMITEDEVAGVWSVVKLSGAVPAAYRDSLLERIDALHAAVKFAREAANGIDVVTVPKVGTAVFEYLYGRQA